MRKNYRRIAAAAALQQRKLYRINHEITAPEVRVIDDQGGHHDVMTLPEALKLAESLELDLIEIQPSSNPPVCKLSDYGKLKYSYEKDVRKQKAKQKKVEVKGIRLSLRIGQHDLDVRIVQAKRFLEQQDKVKIELALRGRERQHADLGKKIIHEFLESLKTEHKLPIVIDGHVELQQGRLSVIIGLKKPQ